MGEIFQNAKDLLLIHTYQYFIAIFLFLFDKAFMGMIFQKAKTLLLIHAYQYFMVQTK